MKDPVELVKFIIVWLCYDTKKLFGHLKCEVWLSKWRLTQDFTFDDTFDYIL